MLDSRATYHFCHKRKWFSSFEKPNESVVIMGNDHACQMVGIGTIRIKMPDGIVRELIDVRYVPQLKKNLISVGAMKSKRLKVTMENETLRITKGSMVVMKGVRDGNLYYLKGSTVNGHSDSIS